MRIPGGDLSPARRSRRGGYGGSYARRKRQRRGRAVLALIALVVVGGGAFYALHRDDDKVPTRLAVRPSCTPAPSATASATKPVALPAPATVAVTVLNGSGVQLRAKHVSDELAADGFRITRQGNAPKALAGDSRVLYGPGANLQARLVSTWVPGSYVVAAPKASRGSVQLVLGSGFTRLATPAEQTARAKAPVTPKPAASRSTCTS